MKFSLDILQRARDAYTDRDEPENILFLSRAAWRASLALAALLALSGILYGAYSLYTTLTLLEATASPLPHGGPAVLDRAALDRTVQGLQNRQSTFDSVKSAPSDFSDPSR